MNNHKTVVVNVVGLTPELVGPSTPFLSGWISSGKMAPVGSLFPAVTCPVQATYLTGRLPSEHGIVGNGWYFRRLDEIGFWRQSNMLIEAPRIWERLRDYNPSFTCANLFWWYNMNSSVDWLATPRPIYRTDGVKIPDILTRPMEHRDELQRKLGRFPLFEFWGPNTTIRSSRWIARSALLTDRRFDPTLTLVYLPHLDYNLQRIGPDHPDIHKDLAEIDSVCAELFAGYEKRGARIVLVSEYGIEPVERPVHLNRVLRENGYIVVREEEGGEVMIPGCSRAFAVADHQVAHIYVRDPADREAVGSLLSDLPGVEKLLGPGDKKESGIDHRRSGDWVAVAAPGCWFTYYYWLDDRMAPDFAPTVDIHNKPGYDPAELLIDPALRAPRLRALGRVLQKKMGFRYRMDLIPLNGDGVRGSHGRPAASHGKGALIASGQGELIPDGPVDPLLVHDIIADHVTGSPGSVSSETPKSGS